MKRKQEIPLMPFCLALALAGATGCVAIPLSQEQRTNVRTTKKLERIDAESVSSFKPAVQRDGSTATIRLEIDGAFTEKWVTTESYTALPRRKASFGLFPGLVNVRPSDRARNALAALWMNVCFAGTPTVNGLLVEPLNPVASAKSETLLGSGFFSRSTLFGFHKFDEPSHDVSLKPKTSVVTKKGPRPVDKIDLVLESADGKTFWKTQTSNDGQIRLTGVAPGEHEGILRIKSIQPSNWFGKELQPLLGKTIGVTIPEE